MTKQIQFKSLRAAKIAYTKAENAWEAARSAYNKFHNENRPFACVDDSDVGEWADEARRVNVKDKELSAAQDAAWDNMKAVYDAAHAQGFYVYSWHFGANATRDLIAANMD
jgi:endogenous inhibitor of DNA gyrase (YacG/DUF329 family)